MKQRNNGRVFVTGDCHGDVRRFSSKVFTEQKQMTKEDVMIILGDFGMIWNYKGKDRSEEVWLDWLEEKSFTTVFVDGNHECFPRLNAFPEETWQNGRVHRLRPSIFHLIRGEIYDICGKKFWAFGGAPSHDIGDGILDPVKDRQRIRRWMCDPLKEFRVDGVSWWKEEMPSAEEMEHGLENLRRNDMKVDFVLSHEAPGMILNYLDVERKSENPLTDYFDQVLAQGLEFQKWFFGHYHVNQQCLDDFLCLYEQMIRIV